MTNVLASSRGAVQSTGEESKKRLAVLLWRGYLKRAQRKTILAMKITDVLRAEHTVFQHLFDHMETTTPRLKKLAEVKMLAVLVDKVLAPHSAVEEELFIEPLEHCFEQIGQSETFHHEHAVMEATLTKVGKARTLADAKRQLLSAIAAGRTHFDKEERIVFPMAERVLKAKTLTDLADLGRSGSC